MLTVFFVNRKSGIVEFIVMADNDFVMRALPNVAIGDNRPDDYWITCTREELEPYLSIDYEVWVDDLSSESDEPGSGGDLDPDDELAWQIEPVQMWAKGESVSLGLIKFRSEFVGFGSGFVFEDVAASFPDIRPTRASTYERPAKSKEHRGCPWCGVSAVRRYNYTRQDFGRESEMPGKMENPVLWTDGAWSEKGIDPNCTEFIGGQYGDCVIVCSACDAMFLASSIEEDASPQYLLGQPLQDAVVKGTVAKGHFSQTPSEAWILTATLDQTMDYLEAHIGESSPLWAQWTAAQQIVNWVTHFERCGKPINPEQDSRGRKLLGEFIPRTHGIIEGIFGSFFDPNLVAEESKDENYWMHNYNLDELIPFKNMRRIVGDWHELDWGLNAPVSNPITFEEYKNSRLNDFEFDDYVVARLILLRTLIVNKDTRWAVHSGELQNLYPSISNQLAKGEPGTVEDLDPLKTKLESESVSIDQGKLDYDSVLALPPENIQVEMRRFLDVLHHRESAVLQYRFGLGDGIPKSYKEIAEDFGVEPQRIRQVEVETLERLRGLKLSLELMEFLS